VEKSELARKYAGDVALSYDSRKTRKEKWSQEQAALHVLLSQLPPNSTLLDVPVGTGRFFEFYKARKLKVTGADISLDMLALARAKAAQLHLSAELQEASILSLPYESRAFDCCVCIRLLNWLEAGDCDAAIQELARVSGKWVILGLRTFAEHQTFTEILFTPLYALLSTIRRRRKRDRINIHSMEHLSTALAKAGLSPFKTIEILPRRPGTTYAIMLATRDTVSH